MTQIPLRDIAQTLLELRKRPAPYVGRGELTNLLGGDGLGEALTRRWLEPTPDFQLTVTSLGSHLQELQNVANSADPEVGDAIIIGDEGESFQGTVQAKLPDGRYQVTFAQKRPRTLRPYKKEEIKRVGQPQAQLDRNVRPVDPNARPIDPRQFQSRF